MAVALAHGERIGRNQTGDNGFPQPPTGVDDSFIEERTATGT